MSEFKSEIAEQAKRLNRSLTNGEVAAINAEYVRWADKEISVLRADLGRALARVAELEYTPPFVKAYMLRKQAEAVEAFAEWVDPLWPKSQAIMIKDDARSRACELRQQADEAEKAGGGGG